MLSVRGVDVRYGQLQVLFGTSIDVARGQIVAVVGANAAGKTTLVNCISGLVPASAGAIEFEGRDITRLPAHRRTDLGLVQVPEGRKLFPKMTVEENLLVAGVSRRARSSRKRTMGRVYDLFPRLRERRGQQAGSLSGGEQQMLAIGRGLMAQPDLLMLDEPSLGLAPLLARDILKTIRDLNRQEGLTILLIEQNLRQSLAIADYGYVLERGRVVLADTGARLLENEHAKRAYIGR